MKTDKPQRTPAERVADRERILAALRSAMHEAFQRHKRAGVPIAVWRDGKVAWIQPEDIPVD